MAVRAFDGSSYITTGAGTLGAIGNGTFSWVMIIKPLTLAAAQSYFGLQHASGLIGGGQMFNDQRMRWVNDNDQSDLTTAGVTADTWQILGMSKTTGTVVPRFHRKALGSGTWTHGDGGSTIQAQAQTLTSVQFGAYLSGSFESPDDCRIACVALFNKELSDADYESIQTTPATQTLADLGPVGLWDFNQASTATPVEDLVGTADEASLVGTTVVNADDPPGWTFGLGAPPVTDTTTRRYQIRRSRMTSW